MHIGCLFIFEKNDTRLAQNNIIVYLCTFKTNNHKHENRSLWKEIRL